MTQPFTSLKILHLHKTSIWSVYQYVPCSPH